MALTVLLLVGSGILAVFRRRDGNSSLRGTGQASLHGFRSLQYSPAQL